MNTTHTQDQVSAAREIITWHEQRSLDDVKKAVIQEAAAALCPIAPPFKGTKTDIIDALFSTAVDIRETARHENSCNFMRHGRDVSFPAMLKEIITRTEANIEKFAAQLKQDPVYAFRWAGSEMNDAAERHLALNTQRWLENGADLETIAKDLQVQIQHAALYPPQSSSACSNQMELAATHAAATLLEKMRFCIVD